MNFPNSIIEHGELTPGQQKKALAIYESVHSKTVLFQALDYLMLGTCRNTSNAFDYKKAILGLLVFISDEVIQKKLEKIEMAGSLPPKEGLINLYAFFDFLDNEDFNVLLELETALFMSNDVEKDINKLYDDRLSQTQKQLSALTFF